MKELATLIRTTRLNLGFKTAKDFWSTMKVELTKKKQRWISYAYYQQIEAGTRLAPINILLTISPYLKLVEREICFLYSKALMPTERTKQYFNSEFIDKDDSISEIKAVAARNWESDRVVNIPESALEYFAKKPLAYDVICAVASTPAQSVEAISKILDLSHKQVHGLVDELIDRKLLKRSGQQFILTKPSIQIHGNFSNKDLLWKVFSRHIEAIHSKYFSLEEKAPCIRTSTCIAVPKDKATEFMDELKNLSKKFDALETPPSEDTQAFYLGMVYGPRFQEEVEQ